MPLPKPNQAVINVWYNHFQPKADLENLTWVYEYRNKIYPYIKERYTNINTIRQHLYTLSKVMKLLGHNKEYLDYAVQYIDLGKKIAEQSLEQKRTPAQEKKQTTFQELEDLRDKYYPGRNKNLRDNFKYLIYALVTLEPPKRLEYGNLPIIENETDAKGNYLLKHDGSYTMVINNDKVAKIPIYQQNNRFKFSEKLSDIITDSLENFPRKYLFTNMSKNKPLGKNNLFFLIKSTNPNGSSMNDIRAAVVNHFYDQKHSLAEKQAFGLRMRHSRAIAERSYQKI